jgi:hypothetical protein
MIEARTSGSRNTMSCPDAKSTNPENISNGTAIALTLIKRLVTGNFVIVSNVLFIG